MIERILLSECLELLSRRAAVVLLGPRQVGKTTLAHEISRQVGSVYLDLESPADMRKLDDPEFYFEQQSGHLIVIDEVQRAPDLFPVIRSQIDKNRRAGRRFGQFLLLGSASNDLLKQTSESLAGRVSYRELTPLLLAEVGVEKISDLWLTGGFPEPCLDSAHSLEWRQDFIRTYLERDIPSLGFRIPAETLHRFWTMLAHHHSQLFNASQIGGSLGVKGQTASHYLAIMIDLLLVRQLQPWHGNTSKRLIKSPKIYIRDSGVLHALLNIVSLDELLGHPVAGPSWEGFVIEQLLAAMPRQGGAYFYRTRAGAEIDLVLNTGSETWALEIKRNLAPTLSRGFHSGCEDIQPDKRWLVYPGAEQYQLRDGTCVGPLSYVLDELLVF